ncbi:MAG: hypothetical protein SCM96_08540 [Acidobacteriota bacterium]|nr:hypothetical protein [Acidobacteriota bacterium]
MDLLPQSADKDVEARDALWRAICVASEDILNRLRIRSIHSEKETQLRLNSPVPDVPTWQLVEALSLLGIILRSEEASADSVRIFGKTGPIEIKEDGVVRFLWSQQTLKGEKSNLWGRPDIIVTTSSEMPNPGNAVRIIEAKCVKKLDTQIIRSEFGKAHDLRVATYLIWSFYSPTMRVVEGAQGLGIDIEAIGFDTKWRSKLIEEPETLISRVAYTQEQVSKNNRFITVYEKVGRNIRDKLTIL